MSEPHYPNITVKLVGEDGNGLAILARAINAARKGGLSVEEIAKFRDEATRKDYDHLLATCMAWFEVE